MDSSIKAYKNDFLSTWERDNKALIDEHIYIPLDLKSSTS